MVNSTTQAITSRGPLGFAISASRLLARSRRNQEPAATHEEVERGTSFVPTTKVRQAFAKTWGWD